VELSRADGWLRRFGGDAVFDIITVCQGKKTTMDWTSVPEALRPHWTKYVFSLADVPMNRCLMGAF